MTPNRHQRRKTKRIGKVFDYPKDLDKSSILKMGPEWWYCPASKRWWPPHSTVRFSGLNVPIKSNPREADETDLPLSISFGSQRMESMEFLKDGKSVPKSGTLRKLPDPLQDDQRGLIITPRAKVYRDAVQMDPRIDPMRLRDSLLYWDRISIPFSNALAVDIGDDGKFLRREGVLTTPVFETYGPWNLAEVANQTFLQTFYDLSKRDGERWSLASDDSSAKFVEIPQVEGHGILFRLHSGIPVPEKGIPLEDILAFRDLRRDERLSFRSTMDDLYRSISAKPDQPLAEKTESEKLQKELADYVRVARESAIPVKFKEVVARISDRTLYGGMAGYGFGSKVLEMSPALASVIGVGGAAFASVHASFGLREKRDTSNPYEYVWQVNSQL